MISKSSSRGPQISSTEKLRPGVVASLALIAMTLGIAGGIAGLSSSEEQGHGHAHGEHVEWTGDAPAPNVRLDVRADTVAGWNLHVQADGFRFAPERAGEAHVAGEGHAHLYVDGEKIARLYGPWVHVSELPDDAERIAVTLTTNDHHQYAADGQPLRAEVTVPSR